MASRLSFLSNHVLKRALDLPVDERAALAFRLLERLEPEDETEVCSTAEEWEEAWGAEICARLAGHGDGIDAHLLISGLRSGWRAG